MGNGFPIGGTIISPMIKAEMGMLGTTFGGNHLACAAAIAVLEIIENEGLVEAAALKGAYLKRGLKRVWDNHPEGVISEIRGEGLMIGVEMSAEFIPVRDNLLFDQKIFTGGAKSNIIRLLPPLTVTMEEIDLFLLRFEKAIIKIKESH
jgi:acetylornithine aminotransferase